MANETDRIILLQSIKKLNEEIDRLEAIQTTNAADRLDKEKKVGELRKKTLSDARKLLKINQELRSLTKQYLESQATLDDRVKNISDQQFFMKDIERKRIDNMNTIHTSLVKNLDKFNQMADLNLAMADLSSDELHRLELLRIEYDEISQSVDKRGAGVKSQLKILEEQNRIAINYANLSETQRDILEGQRQVLEGIKKTIIGTIETATTMYGNLQGAFGGIVTLAGFLEHNITDVNKELGFTILDMDHAAKSAGLLNFFFDNTAGTVKELSNQFGSVEAASFRTQLNVGLISETMGISNTEAVQLMGNFARMNGGSTRIATDMIQTTKEFAKQNKVIPSQVLSDLAGSSEAFALYSKNGGENLIKAAVGARQLGVELGTITGISDTLLDFESSITSELELGAMLGRNINLNKARQLAYDGKIQEAADETLKQLGGISAFNKMDIFQKRESAKAIGISVSELQKMLDNQTRIETSGDIIREKFSTVGGIINTGLNKYLGTTLKGLGGMITATSQVGSNLSNMGFSLKGIGDKIKSLLPGLGGLGSKFQKWTSFGGPTTPSSPNTASVPKGGGESVGKGMSSVTNTLSKIDMNKVLKGAAAMVIVSGAVWVFGKAVQEFMKVSWESIGMAVTSMLALVGAVALLGVLMSSGVGTVAILAGAAAMLVIAGSIWILGKALQEMSIGFTSLGQISGVLSGLVSMISPIGLLTVALTGLAGSLMLLGTAGLVALPALMGLSIASTGLTMLSNILGRTDSSTNNNGISDGSLSEYETKMLEKMDELIKEVKLGRDVYIDREKVTNVVMKTSERRTENVWGLGVA